MGRRGGGEGREGVCGERLIQFFDLFFALIFRWNMDGWVWEGMYLW